MASGSPSRQARTGPSTPKRSPSVPEPDPDPERDPEPDPDPEPEPDPESGPDADLRCSGTRGTPSMQ
ncbi:hypothetical protein GCM10009535_16360 [Streptomyces thermocarboxydovorans]|uniref:Uncharacterized protein n=1 Tax=Streptomyces thermocarboxydovorans TaxID=59298 RepID=A0ABP3SI56_9ACTN